MAAPPSTIQKLAAEFLGTAFLVYIGAGSAAATGVIAAGSKVPFSMAQLGVIEEWLDATARSGKALWSYAHSGKGYKPPVFHLGKKAQADVKKPMQKP